jgi:pimeloyl-ACP methyl ester carboxylesterase
MTLRLKRPGAYVFGMLACLGCANAPERVNPSFPLTRNEAIDLLKREAKTTFALERPLIVCGGIFDIGFGPAFYANELRSYLSGGPIVRVAFGDCVSFEACRRRLLNTIDRTIGAGADPDATIEVDVIGQSMGGLVAMYAAAADPTLGRRVKIRRLYTISSPLSGASRAGKMPLDLMTLIRDMRPGSAFYANLARQPVDFEVVSYTRLRDPIVGEKYTSLPGRGVYWLDGPWWDPPHNGAFRDDRILLDIVRRLRNETTVTRGQPAALPTTRPVMVTPPPAGSR